VPTATFVVSPRQDHRVRELAETLAFELELQGLPAEVSLDGFPAGDGDPAPVPVWMDPLDWLRLEGTGGLPSASSLRRTVAVCDEPPPPAGDADGRALLNGLGAVFATDPSSLVDLVRLGIKARLLRPGYSRSLDRFALDAPRPIDVLFVGTESERRRAVLDAVARVRPAATRHFELAPVAPTAAEADAPLAGGRWELLTEAKLVIVPHAVEGERFQWRAALDAIHAGAVVVSEHGAGIAPLVAGEHVFMASAAALPDVAGALLDAPVRLGVARRDAYERLRDWIPAALWVSILRAVIVEMIGEPSLTPATS
jgi:hypothetical protein